MAVRSVKISCGLLAICTCFLLTVLMTWQFKAINYGQLVPESSVSEYAALTGHNVVHESVRRDIPFSINEIDGNEVGNTDDGSKKQLSNANMSSVLWSHSSAVSVQHNNSGPRLVLLLSSTPRSGSSFIGELLTSVEPSVYFFEPLHRIQNDPCIDSEDCLADYLKRKFLCDLDKEFLKWLNAKVLFRGFFNKKIKMCSVGNPKERKNCIQNFDMTKDCLDAKVRLIKVIRARLNLLESLLADDSLDLKVIQLYRDPRGFMKSIAKFKTWNQDPSHYCSGAVDDMRTYNSLSHKYPDKLLQLSYEKFSMSPYENAELLFEFVYGNRTLPAATIAYLDSHTKQDGGDGANSGMTRAKESNKAYQAWRQKISQGFLAEIESNKFCREGIDLMAHRVFNNVKDVKNLTISMFI